MSVLVVAAGVLGVCVLIVLVLVYLMVRSPVGYQDEEGFHLGEQPRRRFEPGLHVVRSMSDFGEPDGSEPRWQPDD